jgi:hypothetical protein
MLQPRLKPLAHLGNHLLRTALPRRTPNYLHVPHMREVAQPDVLAQGQQVEVAVLRQHRRRVL